MWSYHNLPAKLAPKKTSLQINILCLVCVVLVTVARNARFAALTCAIKNFHLNIVAFKGE